MNLSENIKLFSLVVPVYKQEKTIIKNIGQLQKFMDKLGIPYEIIVVVDGIIDKTYDRAKKIHDKNIKIFGYSKNLGKGNAVKFGMLKAKGDVIGFIDSGMDLDTNGIEILLNYMIFHNADIIIGSKLHPDSIVEYPFQRRLLSTGYRTITQLLFGFKVRDTQVGLKIFKKKVVKDVFPKLVVKRFAFDIELLAVSYARGYHKIYEAPVKLRFNWGSSISSTFSPSFWQIIFSMLWDTLAVYYRLKFLHHYDRKIKGEEKKLNKSFTIIKKRKNYIMKKYLL